METGEAIDPISVKLPLSLRIDDGVITDIGIKDVARDLRTCIEHLKNCLKQVFSFIAVVDVKFKNGTVYFKFDVRDEQQLEAMYECLGKEKNAFSEWLSGFFITRSMELVAGLGLHTKIYCNISMPETVYLRCRLQFCEKEEQKRNINDIESQKTGETKTTVGTVRKTVAQIEKSSSLFTELISTDNMASSGTMSDNCTEQRSPGAYPYDSKESPSSTNHLEKLVYIIEKVLDSSIRSELVRKTLLLYYPCIKGWKVKKIEIQSESKFLNCVMDMHGIDMYECSVFLPKEPLHFSYQYVCHLKGDRIFSWTATPPLKSRKYHLNEYTFQRDSWMSQGQHIHDQNKYDEECLTAHLRDILFHCEAIDIKHACSQIEQLCFRQLLNKNAIHLLKELETVLVTGTGKAKLLFMVVIGNVLTNIQQISQGEILNKSTINILLDNLKLFRLKDLHVSCGKYIYNVCNSLCVNVYGQEMCPVEYLSACYPFYDDSFILQRLRHHIQSGTKVAHDSKSIYDSALSLCCKLYCSSKEDSSEKAQKALDILLRHCPLNMTLYVTSKIIQNKDGMSENEVDIQNGLCIAFQVRIDSELRLIKKEKNIQKLHDLWRNTTMFIKADTQLQTKFEETLLTTLGVLPSSADCPADVVVMFIIESGFFNDKNGKKKLLQIIMDSNNNTVRELFFILSQRQELAEIFNCIDRGEFQDFALKYLTRNSSYFMDKDKELNCFLKRFCRFLNIKYLLQTCNLIEVLDNILLREFDKYQPTELLKHTFVIDKMSKEYKDIDNIFVGHFNKTLKKTSERPEILLDILSIRKGKSIVETSLTARLVCILLDTHALISEESTDFDRFLCLVEQYQFWILIFKCTGQYIDMIQMNVNYKAARACISSIGHHFKTHDVHFKFLQKLERNLQSASSAKKLLQLEFDIIDIERYWSEALKRFKEVKDKLGITCEVMTQVKQKCPTLPDGFDIVLTRVSDNEKRFINGMITASECENDKRMWQDIEQLPNICEYLCKVVSSSVFWNVSSDHVYKRYLDEMERFYEDDPISSVSELFQEGSVCDRTYTSNEKGCLSFMKILQNVGPTEYEVIWKSLTRDDNFQMVDVMRMFGSKPDISREVEIAKSYLHIVVEKEVEVCLNRIFSSDSVERTVDAIESVVHVFGLDWKRDAVFTKSMTSFHNLAQGKADEYTFGDVHVALKTIFSLVANISDDTVNIMTVLGRSTSLIKFISNILDEDIKNLIDAVEDISEQQVQVSTVSALIEVKQFLYPLLRSKDVKSIYELFQLLEKQTNVSKTNSSSLPQKMEDCKQNLHNLKSLYNGVANRGEQTKEMIKNIIQKGTIFFQLNTLKTCTTFQASYKQNKIKELRKQSTLIDLRSRALLLMNTERKTANENRYNRDELMKFVEEIDLCIDIAETLFTLYTSGHTDFMTVKEVVKPYDLLKRKIELNISLDSWLHDINEERKTHYLMNFIKGNQIHILFTYLEENSKNIPLVQTIVHFIHPNMQAEKFKEIYETEKGLFLKNSIIGNWTKQKMLHCIGFSLHKSFEGLQMFQRNIQNNTSKTMNDIVLPGRLLVAQLDECSLLTVRTILALYMNTTQRLPEPNHILFCTFETSWAELELIIRRCLGSMQFYKVNVLFCIANVENLSNELQFKLVEDLRNLPKETQFCLAIICRGSRNHPFIDELSDYTSSVTPVTDKTVRDIFNEHCGNVVTITSKYSGLGKTSFIASEAHRQKRGFVTLHVSGTIRKMHLVDRIDNLHLKKHHVLHIDLGNVDSPSDLDTFLFELVVLRYVSAGTLSVGLQTSVVYIEIANTINETLRNALQTTVLFRRKEIEWSGIDDLTVSRELNSPVQVVCHYLNCLENGSIDSKDISFNEKSEKPLKSKHCKFLLHKYIGGKLETSYPTVLTFINVLSDQLKKMSQSSFFKSKRLIDMIGNKVKLSVKSQLLAAMIDVSYDFATRSIDVCRESQISAIQTEENIKSDLASSVTDRVNSMIRWEDSNHLMFLFHNQNIHTISALYRNLTLVPKEIRSLFESQMKKDMEDFKCMDQEKLQTMLQRVARVNPLPLPKKELLELSKDYALTADNLLKMVLITLRIKANIPVVVMGETGCGKTSLIRYLAAICEVDFDVMNIHAGVKEEDIIYKVMGNNTKALEQLDKEMWLFLDEINTSDCLGIMSDIICHHKCLGKELSPNLTIMGACNPYKLRTTKALSTAGLAGKAKSDELSRLVYRVLPLPEMMVDYIWDFGCLNGKDERTYIYQMTHDVFKDNEKHHQLFTYLLAISQSFVRKQEESSYSVSLRDIHRCKILTKWFLHILPKKVMSKNAKSISCSYDIRSMILSLAHCYQSRFGEKRLRKEYRSIIGDVFKLHEYQFPGEQDQFINTVIKEEQFDLLRRMRLPPGIARNVALQENVFVIFVCIFNKIPIFVVGKPGCSKSLAMQLIKSNLRGKDSEDDFFRELPQLYCVSFQGSESSTSDGIIKVFEKAEKYQESNNSEEVLSVVVLDEIGLAEVSRFNPLKVLHNLLEPDGASQPNVAVVGISNWALDASKMNRAIHLSRTDMDDEELFDTAISISESFLGHDYKKSLFKTTAGYDTETALQFIRAELNGMAKAYFEYINNLRFKNFHGLRDYYSLIKFVARMFAAKGYKCTDEDKADFITDGIARNFGGLPDEVQTLYDVFQQHLRLVNFSEKPTMNLIVENIKDPIARHLMLITTGESVLSIIEHNLKDIGCDRKEVIFGSQFEEDLTDDYNYRILSKIILCMEEGVVLVLKDLESIYGSLYDMLNQNYTLIGKKKNCRVALGPYSNPMCHVADSFRCIVLTDERKIDLTDPPFLNRFEKQYLRFYDIIQEKHAAIIKRLENWINDLSDTTEGIIENEELFPIYSKDLTASLVLKTESGSIHHEFDYAETIFTLSKDELLWIIKPEILIRQRSSKRTNVHGYLEEMMRQYFSLPIHHGIENFILKQIENAPIEELSQGLLTIIFTNSNVHTKVTFSKKKLSVQIEKLGTFKSEKQLSSRIQSYWDAEDSNILIMHCNAKDDERHILLTKLVIERYRTKYIGKSSNVSKHVYFIIHLDRSRASSNCVSQLNFLSEWKLVMMDSLEVPAIPLPVLTKMTLQEAIREKRPFRVYIQEELFWAFSRIRYGKSGRDIDSISLAIEKMENSPELFNLFEKEILQYIQKQFSGKHNKCWLTQVACDVTALASSSGFIDALEHYIMDKLKAPLAKLIFRIEQTGILESFFQHDVSNDKSFNQGKRLAWISGINNQRVFSIEDVPDETGPECYTCDTVDLALKMPFSKTIYERIESTKDEFMEMVRIYRVQCLLNEDEELPFEVYDAVCIQQEQSIFNVIPDLSELTYREWEIDYFKDFCDMTSYMIFTCSVKMEIVQFLQLILGRQGIKLYQDPFTFMIRLHATLWVHYSSIRAEMILIDKCISVIPESANEILNILSMSASKASKHNNILCYKDGKILDEDMITEQNGSDKTLSVLDKGYMTEEQTDSGINVETKHFSVRESEINQVPQNEDHERPVLYSQENKSKITENQINELGLIKDDSTRGLNIDSDITANTYKEGNNKHCSSTDDDLKEYSLKRLNSSQETDLKANAHEYQDENSGMCQIRLERSVLNDLENVETQEHNLLIKMMTPHINGFEADTTIDLGNNDTYSERLIITVCKYMLPTAECLKQHNGLQQWLEEVTSMISLAAQVSRFPTIIYSIRVCIEIASQIIIPLNMNSDILEDVGAKLKHGTTLDSDGIFCSIASLVENALSVKEIHSENVITICQRFLSSYFVRCLSADPDTKAYQFLFTLFVERKVPENYVACYKVPLSTFIQTVDVEYLTTVLLQEHSKSYFSEEINTDSSDDDFALQFLDCLDNCVKTMLKCDRTEDPFLILIEDILEDIFERYFLQSNNNAIETEDTCPDESLVELFYICHKAIKSHGPGLKYLASVAFCKTFVSYAVIVLQKANSEECVALLRILDVVLDDLPGQKIHPLAVFFLKKMLKNVSISKIENMCVCYTDTSFMQTLPWTKDSTVSDFFKSPLCVYITETDHENSCQFYETLEVADFTTKIKSLVSNSCDSKCGMLQLFSFIFREFYLQLCYKDIDDTKHSLAQLVLNEVMGSGMCKETKSFVSCILGEQNFATGDFLLTNASSNSYTCKASFLVSLYSLVLAQDESSSKMYDTDNQLKPFFIRCLLFPRCISSCFIPGFPCYATENKAEGTQSLYNCYMGVCQCGHRILSEDSVSSITCGICSRTIICTATTAKSNLTVLLSQGQNLNLDDIHVSKLINPVTSHILQLLFKGCFLGSVALGFTSKKLLEDILNVPEIDIVDTLSRGVDTHWNVIKDLLNVDDNGILAFLHTVFLKTGNHLFDTNCNFSNMEATLKWERTFDIMLMSILDTHCVNVRILYQRHNRIHNGENRSITMCLLESDDISNLTAESKLICSPVMYRIRACPSKSNFIYELHNVQDKFPLIDAVIEQEEKLELPKHILNLIQWHAATVANASYMLRRHDCSTMTVQDFIYFKQDTMKKDVIKQRFEAFRKSWEYLMLKLKDDNSFEQMKRIHSESKITECLMLSKNSLPFKILQKLIGIQNAFLDKILLLSRTCSALKVLRKEKIYALPCVKVTELKKEHLVHSDIDWDNLLQQESHSNLNYGCGRQINYDFYSIEEAIALEMIFGKCYIILENTLPEIVFIDELHKNYGNLIRELRKSVPQRPLTSDISNGIKSRKAEDPRMSTELLSHLGIVMTLLKKTSGDSDIPLVEYVDKWKYILCRDFPKKLLPSPESSMKLGHVVALSELLEELCADSVKEGLDDVYRDKLDGPLHDHIMLQLKDNLISSLLFKALKRFTYRCLTSRIADPKQSLRLYLSDDSFWPMDIFQDNALLIDGKQLNITEVLPDGLMVRHIFECFELMEAEMERKKQGQLKMSGFATSFQAKAKMSAPSKKEQKKKRTTNIRKF